MKKVTLPLQILGSGICLPQISISTQKIEQLLGVSGGTLEKKVGVISRPVRSNGEDQISLGIKAAKNAIEQSNISLLDIDLILFASAVGYQSIPATAPLIMRGLNIKSGQAAAFDVNSTCLSFVTALDMAACFLNSKRYKTILIVSSEIASMALPWHDDAETAALFGDGAAAMLVSSSEDASQGISAASMATWPEGYEHCQLGAGGTRFNPQDKNSGFDENVFFRMQGKAVFRQVRDHFNRFISDLLEKAGWHADDIDVVVPHQASPLGLAHIIKMAPFKNAKFINILANHGNQISASIPIAFHHGLENGLIKRGSKVLLIGTSAGLSIGGILLKF